MNDPCETGALRVLEEEQWQVDEDGVGCGVSRQALDEVLTHYKELRSERDALLKDRERLEWLITTFESSKGGAFLSVNEELGTYEEPASGKEVQIQWYPDTPIGFYVAEAATIREAIDEAMRLDSGGADERDIDERNPSGA